MSSQYDIVLHEGGLWSTSFNRKRYFMLQNVLSTYLKKILVIEDDTSIGEVIQLILSQDAAYRPLVIDNPGEALETAKRVQPDLFIIDYHLSGIDGIHLYDQMHSFRELQKIPAIITTASLESHMQELEERGLVGLAKPFDIDDLLTTVKQVMLQSEELAHLR